MSRVLRVAVVGHTDVTVALRYQHATAQRDRALTELLSREIEF